MSSTLIAEPAEGPAATGPLVAPEPPAPPVRGRLGVLARSGLFWTGLLILLFWAVCAVFGSAITPYDPFATDLLNELDPPSWDHLFGTDQLGRDVLSRVVAGARGILTVAPLATLLGIVGGTVLGLLTGYFRGVADVLVGRVVEVLVALPLIIVALLALTALGPSTLTVIAVVGVVFAPLVARTVRAAVLQERGLDYVSAAELRGEGPWHIMFVEILPNVVAPIIVETTVRLGYAIFTIASLSFLGFGIQPPSPDWGLTIAENYGVIGGGYWWTVVFAAGATASLVVGVNLLAEGLHGALQS